MKKIPVVLIVEDEPAIAELIAVNLRHSGFEPMFAADGASAQRALHDTLPDLILLDWMLPDESGLVLAKRWRKDPRTQEVPVIMLTARAEELDRVAGLDAGADDYITKPFSARELLARIRAVLRRTTLESAADVVSVSGLVLDLATHRVNFLGQPLTLGPTEFKLLRYLMCHPERVHSREQLLNKVWGDQVYIEERTVDVHIKRLRKAMGVAGEMIQTVRGAGYRLSSTALPHVDGSV